MIRTDLAGLFGRRMAVCRLLWKKPPATPAQLDIHELNLSIYCFDAKWLWGALKRMKVSAKGEYYLTDVVAIAREDERQVQANIL